MKHPFFKSILVLGAALALMNCSDENTTAPTNDEYVTPDACWVLNADQTMLIYATGVVTDAKGNPVGIMNDDMTAIVSLDGTQFIVSNLNLATLTIIQAGETVPESSTILPASSASVTTPTSSTTPVVNPTSSAATTTPKSSATGTTTPKSSATTTVKSSSSQAKSSSSQQQQQQAGTNSDGTCYDKRSNKNVAPYTELVGANGEKYAYKNDCTIDCWWDGSNNNCANALGGSSTTTTQPKSSSSQQQQQQKSSSSQAKSSSSSQQQQQQSGGGTNLLPKIVDGNKKYGYATRYWDSCKPHCAWSGKGGPVSRTCSTDGVSEIRADASSVCDGGNAGTCFDQVPQIVNDTIAYAFAATPGGGNDCGKCYMLTFTGEGAGATGTPTDDHHRKIKGKHLIVISNNIGYDVSSNQFDLMIPGGGPGAYNGCGKMGISCKGAQYGGFLTTCNYDKSCLINMCKQEYSNANLQKGCLFLAEWMDAANNPAIEFVQVECPAALEAKY